MTVASLNLYSGNYSIELWLGDRTGHRVDYIREAITFEIAPTPSDMNEFPLQRSGGLVYQKSHWTMQRKQVES